MSNGKKIIDGLKDAVAGNFARVTIDGQVWKRIALSTKSVVINLRLKSGEKERFMEAAKLDGVTLSEFVRSAAMAEAHRVLGPPKIVKSRKSA